MHRINVLSAEDRFEILCKTRVFDCYVDTFKVDERIEGVDAAETFGRVAPVCDELCDLIVDGIVKGLE